MKTDSRAPKQVHSKNPKISLRLTRDSVCAGDDCDAPHEKVIETFSFVAPEALIRDVLTYLPRVSGVGHSWVCRFNGVIIGEIDAQGIHPSIRELKYEELNDVHFSYRSAPY